MKKLEFFSIKAGTVPGMCSLSILFTLGGTLPLISLFIGVLTAVALNINEKATEKKEADEADLINFFRDYFNSRKVLTMLTLLLVYSVFPFFNTSFLFGLNYFLWALVTISAFGIGLALYVMIKTIQRSLIFLFFTDKKSPIKSKLT